MGLADRFAQLEDTRLLAAMFERAPVGIAIAGITGRYVRANPAFLRLIGRHRGFVLLGHSQGSYHLERLIRRRIDSRRALRRRMVSAVLLGGNVTVRERSDRGGTFHHSSSATRAPGATALTWNRGSTYASPIRGIAISSGTPAPATFSRSSTMIR